MSAKEFYHKNIPPHLPYLPPELWKTIIQHATWVPGGYDPELTTLAIGVSANTMNKDRLDVWKKALVTRRFLVQVSKTWWELASPFLYEYILLGRGKAVPPLLSGLQRSQAGVKEDDTAYTIGWRTKRLDVNLRDSTDHPETIMDALAQVMTYLPNLQVLTFSITGHHYQRTLSPKVLMSVSCSETLKFVHFYTTCTPAFDNWTHFLEKHPHLEVVNLNNITEARSLRLRLDSLQTIHLHAFYPIAHLRGYTYLWNNNLPAVRTATYDMELSDHDDLLVELFFTKIGPKLRTIQVNQLYPAPDMEVEASLRTTFGRILSECHALEQINLLLNSWSMVTFVTPRFPPKVSTLVIRIIKGQISKKMVIHLLQEIFLILKIQNSNLQTIQFSSGINVRELRTHSRALAEGIRFLKAIGITIKDDEGCIME